MAAQDHPHKNLEFSQVVLPCGDGLYGTLTLIGRDQEITGFAWQAGNTLLINLSGNHVKRSSSSSFLPGLIDNQLVVSLVVHSVYVCFHIG